MAFGRDGEMKMNYRAALSHTSEPLGPCHELTPLIEAPRGNDHIPEVLVVL
jgi:hypothetical protein